MRNIRNLVAASGLGLMLLAAAGPSVAQVIIVPPPPAPQPQRRPTPRQYTEQMTHYIRTTLTVNMCGTPVAGTCAVQLGTASLPFNAIVTRVYLAVYTPWNSTTSDALTLGTSQANANELVATTMNLQTLGLATATLAPTVVGPPPTGILATGHSPPASVLSGFNGGFDLWVKWVATGAPNATPAGLASIIIEYIAPNDGNCAQGTPIPPAPSRPAGC
jgi:hypothetical protein